MKNKIAVRLTIYFSSALLVFSVIIGAVFMGLFRTHTIELHKEEMEKKAVNIANNLPYFVLGADNKGLHKGARGGYGAYIRFINDVDMSDIWIIDENYNIISRRQGANGNYRYEDLPQNAENVVKEAFEGGTSFSESFSPLLNMPTLTVGTPITTQDGEIIGAVLMHSPIEGTNEAVLQGIIILAISIGAALVLSVLLSVGLSLTFTKPLNKMKGTALKLADGDYSVKNNIIQNDEIGELAGVIDELSDRLYKAAKQSENLEQMRRDFIANISHELRTPVTVIRGSLEALCDEVITEKGQVQQYHEQMLSESKGLERLVNDLLDLSRLQNTDFKTEMAEISICDVLDDAIRSAKNIADKKGVKIIVSKSINICFVKGDYYRLRQMIMIIIDNAVKFSPEKGNILISLNQTDYLYLSIKDDGQGIPKEDLPYIFDRFYKSKSADNKSGTGLGLAIAKQIALRHGIEISVNSKQGSGCEFIFKIPILKQKS